MSDSRKAARVSRPAFVVTSRNFDAVLFDMDGVLTDTAGLHAACWKQMLDEFLAQRAGAAAEQFRPFDMDVDYHRYLDGKPRHEGIVSFLEARGIELPYGNRQSPPDGTTICGLGNRKNELVDAALRAQGVRPHDDAVTLARDVRQLGIKTAVVSSSTNCRAVLQAAGITALFDLCLDGVVAARFRIAGKPAPDTYLRAAEELSAAPGRAVVVEDAIAGVQAGKAGGFGLVIGVDRRGDGGRLRKQGADLVVRDLDEISRGV